MGKVRLLSDRVANQIAAGEVIERPSAVVKELVENSLDAGATRVQVLFAHAGRSLIRVDDNGNGMAPEDARLSIQRHATSKLWEASDLDRMATFGFRGEAIPSIASVSKFTLQTRQVTETEGVEIVIHAGKLVHEKACGMPVGTRVAVEDLFDPVPARRKFLKTDRTESAHIIHCVRLYALAFPSVAFTLVEDGQEVFRSPACTSLGERIAEIFGRDHFDQLLELKSEEGGMRITGFIGKPSDPRPNRHDMIVFVNLRPVDSRTLNQSLIEGYRDHFPVGRYPAAYLFFECDPAWVDVNVHPAKREIRFRNEYPVRAFVIGSVVSRLHQLAPSMVQAPPRLGGTAFPEPVRGWVSEPAHSPGPAPTEAAMEPGPETQASHAPSWRFLGLAHGSLALFESGAGLVLLDRRAACERIWFERLTDQFRNGQVPIQQLLLPIPVELDPVSSAVLFDHLAFLKEHGFEILEFGRNFYRIEALPGWMEPGDAAAFLRDVLGALREGKLPSGNPGLARQELAKLAATKAIRLAPESTEPEMRGLLSELFATSSPLASPSGRPTFIELNHSELAKRFQK